MAFAAGVASVLSVGSNTAQLSATAATGASGTVTYQWYRSITTGFTPGGGNIISGATSLSLNDSGLIPNTPYFWKLQATDSVGPVTVTYTQVTATTTASSLSPNQFAQTPTLGMIDMRFPYNSVAVLIDVSQATALYAGSAVKMVDSVDGVPKVVGCAANSDEVLGFINFDIKNVSFLAGNAAEISMGGNVMYLYSTVAIARGVLVELDLSSPGSVAASVVSSGNNIVGWAYDKAPTAGTLIRVFLRTPSFLFS